MNLWNKYHKFLLCLQSQGRTESFLYKYLRCSGSDRRWAEEKVRLRNNSVIMKNCRQTSERKLIIEPDFRIRD